MNRVKAGFFSLSHRSPSGNDRHYLEWHQLDHMPEQYQLTGMLLGQRWASTPACRAARQAEVDRWSLVEHLVCYLMGSPLEETLDEFYVLARHLAELGRFTGPLPSQYAGALRLLETHAAPSILVSSGVVPWRPHRGIYLVVEALDESTSQDEFLQRLHVAILPEVVQVAGVAGAWLFGTSPSIRRPAFSEGTFRMTVCYLDGEPARVAEQLGPVVERAWAPAPSQLVLAAPFESILRWDWDRFSPAS